MIEIPDWLFDLSDGDYRVEPFDEGGGDEGPPPCSCDGDCSGSCVGSCAGACQPCSGGCAGSCNGCQPCSGDPCMSCQTRCQYAQAVTDWRYMGGGFSWYPSVSQGSPIIKASEWNKLCDYVKGVYNINNKSINFNYANSQEPFYAYMFNEVNNAIKGLVDGNTGISDKSFLDIIYSYDFNTLANTVTNAKVDDIGASWIPTSPSDDPGPTHDA